MKEIKLYEILGIDIALSESQAEKVMKEMDFESETTLDFEGIKDVTTAFIRRIMDGYVDKPTYFITQNLLVKNHNDSVKFAYTDAFRDKAHEISCKEMELSIKTWHKLKRREEK